MSKPGKSATRHQAPERGRDAGQGGAARTSDAGRAGTPVTRDAARAAAPRPREVVRPAPARTRDPGRVTRKEMLEQRRVERAEALARERKQQQVRRWGLVGVGVAIVALIVYAIVRAVQPAPPAPVITGTGTFTAAPTGETRDGMSCLGTEGTLEHIHMYLAIYIDGQQYPVPANTGIVNNNQCFYPLHVHGDQGDANIIHEESPSHDTYTLGAFFDIWGQQLSRTQVLGNKADAKHALTFVTFDENGKKTVVTGNPLGIKFTPHETIYILYNSPNVTPQPYTQFLAGE